jgi:hypothetical protein
MEILEAFDPDAIKLLLQADPKNYLELLDKVARLQKSKAESDRVKVGTRQNDMRLKQAERALELDQERFQLQFCKGFAKWAKDQRALDLLSDKKLAPPVQMQKLRDLMFGPVQPGQRGYEGPDGK